MKGRLRSEQSNWIVRSVARVYRPTLNWFLDRPAGIVWVIAIPVLVGAAAIGERSILLGLLAVILLSGISLIRCRVNKLPFAVSLTLIALTAEQQIVPQ